MIKQMPKFKPEVLAPVGDFEVLQAALQGGADAVYFGLAEGFNARARAQNFTLSKLAAVVREVHSAGAKVYLTVNTLIFEDELSKLKALMSEIEAAGVDSIIVQDFAVSQLARVYAPHVHLHASTQMTISDGYGVQLVRSLGFNRVVLARETTGKEIAKIAKKFDCELEVFALGALCVSYSGQCLASLAWGGRSANRGQCAQPCRLIYRWVSVPHGRKLDYNDPKVKLSGPSHLLSPRDLASFVEIGNLINSGVRSLKIEGRLKGANYVYMATKTMRAWVDAHFDADGNYQEPTAAQILALRHNLSDLSVTFSRGFTPGFLHSCDHQSFVQKGSPKHRGQLLGRVLSRDRHGVKVELIAESSEEADAKLAAYPIALQRGMGALFLAPDSQQNQATEIQGGPIFACRQDKKVAVLEFGHPGPDLNKVNVGDFVYISGSPQVNKRIEQELEEPRLGRLGLILKISGRKGEPLHIKGIVEDRDLNATVHSQVLLKEAQKKALDSQSISRAFGELRQTPFHLASVDDSELEGGLFLPLSEFKPMRRALVEELSGPILEPSWKNAADDCVVGREAGTAGGAVPMSESELVCKAELMEARPELSVLCRSVEQVEAALEAGCELLELEAFKPQSLEELVEAGRRNAKVKIHLVAPRIQMDGEEKAINYLLKLKPDGLLLRNLGSFEYWRSLAVSLGQSCPVACGDFSLNITNSLSASALLKLGLSYFTISDDVDGAHLEPFLKSLKTMPLEIRPVVSSEMPKVRPEQRDGVNPAVEAGTTEADVVRDRAVGEAAGTIQHREAGRVSGEALIERAVLTLYRHIPTFHTKHCLYADLLSSGRDSRTCGRPCLKNDLYVVDRRQYSHLVKIDYLCRGSIFNQTPLQRQDKLPLLVEYGLKHYRVELLNEDKRQARKIIDYYRRILAVHIH